MPDIIQEYADSSWGVGKYMLGIVVDEFDELNYGGP